MNTLPTRIACLLISFFSISFCFGQKPATVQVNSLINRIPALEASNVCYEASTRETDPSNGSVSIKDNGHQFNELNEELNHMMNNDMNAMKNQSYTAANQAASAQDAQQAQAQAMQQQQQAAQMANMTPEQIQQMVKNSNHTQAPQKTDVNLMKRIGQAQSALANLQQVLMEFDMKFAKISYTDKTTLKLPPNCPEVQQGGYAGPTCSCERERAITSANTYVVAVNSDLEKMKEMIAQYKQRIADQVAVIDKLEIDYKYGDAVTDPSAKQMMWSMQKQALNGFVDMLAKVSSGWSDGAKAYARVMTAKNRECKN
jgi:type II secretory pathway pseudopilin PulG